MSPPFQRTTCRWFAVPCEHGRVLATRLLDVEARCTEWVKNCGRRKSTLRDFYLSRKETNWKKEVVELIFINNWTI